MLARINRNYVPAYWDDFFNDHFYKNVHTSSYKSQTPAVNVVEEENGYKIEMAIPGVSKKDFHIEVEDDVLTISTESQESKKEQQNNYLRREFNFQSFKRSFELPETVDQENIQASHADGILTVHLSKKEEVLQKAPKQIEVK